MSPVTVLPGNEIDLTTVEPKRLALSITEMKFALGLRPCIACNAFERDHVNISYFGPLGSTAPAWQKLPKKYGVRCECPNCGAERRLLSWTVDNAEVYYDRYHLVGTGPCTIIEPHEFIAELDRLMPLISVPLSELHHPEFDDRFDDVERALTCANELRKFIVPGRTRLAEREYTAYGIKHRTAHRPRYDRDTNAALFPQLKALYDKYVLEVPRIHAEKATVEGPPKIRVGELNRDTIRAHEAWLKGGRAGEGQLRIEHQQINETKLYGKQWAASIWRGIEFNKVLMSANTLDDSLWEDIVVKQSTLDMAQFKNATLKNPSFATSVLNFVKFTGATITNGVFKDSELYRVDWNSSTVENTVFDTCLMRDSKLAGATFKHCDFRGNFLGISDRYDHGSTAGARFEDCDFRRTGWHNRDLSGATFIRCKFAGSGGSPRAHDGLVLQDCEMTRDEFLAMLAAWEVAQAAKDRDAAALKNNAT